MSLTRVTEGGAWIRVELGTGPSTGGGRVTGLHAETVVGILIVAAGAGLMALGAARQGCAVRPLAPARAWAAAQREQERVLRRAAGRRAGRRRGRAGASPARGR
ncbi:hypothetical protein ABZ957_32720, partial [Streptomyces sp. NPDC046316]|uniref:hypothetical protein n=1 Tax=Streptomyces sp. NPDC046316 TaxID=3154494 RepID=UPI0033F47068